MTHITSISSLLDQHSYGIPASILLLRYIRGSSTPLAFLSREYCIVYIKVIANN